VPKARTARQTIVEAVRDGWQRAWLRRGVDITSRIDTASCLVIAPHPDDETLGCAVAIGRKLDHAAPVHVIIVTDGGLAPSTLGERALVSARRQEAKRATAALGLRPDQVRFLDFADGSVASHVDALADVLLEAVTALAPEQVLVPVSCDGHPDHEAVNRAIAATLSRLRGPAPAVLEYPIWLWTHWPYTRGYHAGWSARRFFVDPVQRLREVRPLLVDATGYRERQAAALRQYTTQLTVDSGVPAGDVVPPELVRRSRGRYEVYLPFGALRHLDGETSG
jgi:LmbE family N-acetylglucosaminyl deacetylase